MFIPFLAEREAFWLAHNSRPTVDMRVLTPQPPCTLFADDYTIIIVGGEIEVSYSETAFECIP